MGRSRLRTRDVIIVVVLITLAFLVGFSMGGYAAAKVAANLASGFLDPELVQQAITQYSHNVGNCFPVKNFTI